MTTVGQDTTTKVQVEVAREVGWAASPIIGVHHTIYTEIQDWFYGVHGLANTSVWKRYERSVRQPAGDCIPGSSMPKNRTMLRFVHQLIFQTLILVQDSQTLHSADQGNSCSVSSLLWLLQIVQMQSRLGSNIPTIHRRDRFLLRNSMRVKKYHLYLVNMPKKQ